MSEIKDLVFKANPNVRTYKDNNLILFFFSDLKQKVTKSNKAGYEIWRLLNDGYSVRSIASSLSREYKLTPEHTTKIVNNFVNKLLKEGLILETSRKLKKAEPSIELEEFQKPEINSFSWDELHNKIERPRIPIKIYLDVTTRCNLRCKHCYFYHHLTGKGEDMNIEKVKLIIDKIDKKGIPLLCLLGAEPFMREDIPEIVEYASKKGILIDVITNGTLLNEKKILELKKAGICRLVISLDGADAKTHDSIRGEGSFKKTVENIKLAIKHGLNVTILFTILRTTFHQIFKIHKLTRKLGVKDLIFNIYRITPGTPEQFMICPTPLQNVLFWFLIKPLILRFKNPKVGIEDIWSLIPKRRKVLCKAGFIWLRIDVKGNVHPCPTLDFPLGNIFTDGLDKIWNSKDLLNITFERCEGEPCSYCPLKKFCSGKCKAEVYALTGDITSGNPRCSIGRFVRVLHNTKIKIKNFVSGET